MERKFLKDLGVADEAIDKVMAENGKDVEKVKGELKTTQDTLKTAQDTLKSFEGVDVKDLQGKVKQLTDDLKAKDTDYAAKLDERDFNAALKSAAAKVHARNHDAVVAVLGTDKVNALKASKNREKDIEDALTGLKADKEQAYLFEAERVQRTVGPTPGAVKDDDTAKSKANEGLRALFGKGE